MRGVSVSLFASEGNHFKGAEVLLLSFAVTGWGGQTGRTFTLPHQLLTHSPHMGHLLSSSPSRVRNQLSTKHCIRPNGHYERHWSRKKGKMVTEKDGNGAPLNSSRESVTGFM